MGRAAESKPCGDPVLIFLGLAGQGPDGFGLSSGKSTMSTDCSDRSGSSGAPAVGEGVLIPDRCVTVADRRSGHDEFRHVTTRDSFEDTDPSAHNFT